MGKTNVILTIPQPKKFELVELPYPNIKSGYAIIQNEIAPICLEGTRIWAEHDFEFHDDPTHLGHESVGTVVEVLPDVVRSLGIAGLDLDGDPSAVHPCN